MTQPPANEADYSAPDTPAQGDTHALGRHLLDQFADGWSRGRPDLMLPIFAPDAVFMETPFSEPLSGFTAIQEWASDIPYQQSEPSFTTGEVFTVGPWFSAEFKLLFRRRKTGEWVEARGARLRRDSCWENHRIADVLAPLERGAGNRASLTRIQKVVSIVQRGGHGEPER